MATEIKIPRLYSFWARVKEKRIFQIIDRPVDGIGWIVLLEVKDYRAEDLHNVKSLSPQAWEQLRITYGLTPYVPQLR